MKKKRTIPGGFCPNFLKSLLSKRKKPKKLSALQTIYFSTFDLTIEVNLKLQRLKKANNEFVCRWLSRINNKIPQEPNY